eukprot:1856195-Pyramimonas_sp.AAC.1
MQRLRCRVPLPSGSKRPRLPAASPNSRSQEPTLLSLQLGQGCQKTAAQSAKQRAEGSPPMR